MRILDASGLIPGKRVWLENNGFVFKELRVSQAVVLAVTAQYVYFFPFQRLPIAAYNKELTWRCWDAQPDIDTVCETEWAA